MGQEVGRIVKEYVFKELVDHEVPVKLHGDRKDLVARIRGVHEDALDIDILEGDKDALAVGEELRLYFHFQGKFHTCSSSVVANSERGVRIRHPGSIYRDVERKFERVRVPDVDLVISLRDKDVELNFPKSAAYSPDQRPVFSADYQPRQIEELLAELKEHVQEVASGHRIVMLRDKQPSSTLEELIVRTRRTVWIPTVIDEFPFYDPFPEERIVTRQDLADRRDPTGKDIVAARAEQGVWSELLCPILYNEYVVGYVHVVVKDEKKEHSISEELVDWTFQFAKVLCYSLHASGCFGGGDEERVSASTILDISASGLLFAHNMPELAEGLEENSEAEMVLRIGGRELQIGGRIARRLHDESNNYFGVEFVRISPDTFSFLYEALYGKPFDPEFEEVMEGGLRADDQAPAEP